MSGKGPLLSVNINKIATLRNSRGGNLPDVQKAAVDCQSFGAEGITVHPRPDERHIRYSDARLLRPLVKTEYNIEGNPIPSFLSLVLEVRPEQVTLVPDAHDAITSNSGWDTVKHKAFLTDICKTLKDNGIRPSIFVDPNPEAVYGAAECGCQRVELYTASYAEGYGQGRERAIEPFVRAAEAAREAGLGLNAGHDLNLQNLEYFVRSIPWLEEVSIGHALISDALYLGLKESIRRYLLQTKLA